jgi:DNA repair exonuclease SbcCD ATPase subunit
MASLNWLKGELRQQLSNKQKLKLDHEYYLRKLNEEIENESKFEEKITQMKEADVTAMDNFDKMQEIVVQNEKLTQTVKTQELELVGLKCRESEFENKYIETLQQLERVTENKNRLSNSLKVTTNQSKNLMKGKQEALSRIDVLQELASQQETRLREVQCKLELARQTESELDNKLDESKKTVNLQQVELDMYRGRANELANSQSETAVKSEKLFSDKEAQQQRIETLQQAADDAKTQLHQLQQLANRKETAFKAAMKNIEDELKRAREKESEMNRKLEKANEIIESREKLQVATKQRELEGLKSQSVEIKQLLMELKNKTLESTKSDCKLPGIVVQQCFFIL